ncbi:unnamed protein product [Auanema sp. JU1783]|nr:unnamed protein product [Auanema sp. JU1783]
MTTVLLLCMLPMTMAQLYLHSDLAYHAPAASSYVLPASAYQPVVGRLQCVAGCMPACNPSCIRLYQVPAVQHYGPSAVLAAHYVQQPYVHPYMAIQGCLPSCMPTCSVQCMDAPHAPHVPHVPSSTPASSETIAPETTTLTPEPETTTTTEAVTTTEATTTTTEATTTTTQPTTTTTMTTTESTTTTTTEIPTTTEGTTTTVASTTPCQCMPICNCPTETTLPILRDPPVFETTFAPTISTTTFPVTPSRLMPGNVPCTNVCVIRVNIGQQLNKAIEQGMNGCRRTVCSCPEGFQRCNNQRCCRHF